MSGLRRIHRMPIGLAAIFIWALGASTTALAQSIQEFTVPGISQFSSGSPSGIAVGPDGALWFALGTRIGRITTAGSFSFFPLSTDFLSVQGITSGPDGALWFTDLGNPLIGRITASGTVTEFPTPAVPEGITTGPDGALWFTEFGAGKIGRITTSGAVTDFPTLHEGTGAPAGPLSIVTGPDGALWFTDKGTGSSAIGRITTAGSVSEFRLPAGTSQPSGIAAGSDGALWFTFQGGSGGIGRITTNGQITIVANDVGEPESIAAGPDGSLWFTTSPAAVGRTTTGGASAQTQVPTSSAFCDCVGIEDQIVAGPDGGLWFTETAGGKVAVLSIGPATLLSAVLPSSRSIQVGNTATAFATIINAGTSSASGCAIAPVTSVPANFTYQTTNPATNALTGAANTPATIAAGQSQTFVFALSANASVTPTQVVLGFDCSGTNAAPSNTGLNTLLYSASSSPIPDIVALSATATNDGILHITGTNGSNAFALATVNVGASSSIIASANTGSMALPLSLSLCQTNPTNGQCVSAVGPTVTTTINANATPTFAVFGTADGSIAFSPAANRIFVQFTDSNGVVHGSTSVAVETQ